VRPRLRKNQGQRYLVHNPDTGSVFEMREEEYALCQLLDGTSSPATVLSRFHERCGTTIAPEHLDAFIQQLDRAGFLVGRRASPTFVEHFEPEQIIPSRRWRLGSGDRFFGVLATRLRWLFSWPLEALGVVAIVLAATQLYANWDAFSIEFWRHHGGLHYLQIVAIAVLFIQPLRTVAQAITCKRYGGQITGVGVYLLYYIQPGFYCDLSSIVWFTRRSHRFWVAFAGIHVQLLVWAAATLFWVVATPDTLARLIAMQVVIAAAAGIVLFSANPLAKMDGYLILSGWLEIPRLRERSLAVLGAWLVGRPNPEPLTRTERSGFAIYGLLVLVYGLAHFIFVLTQLGVPMIETLGGPGALLTLGVAVYIAQRPVLALVRQLAPFRWIASRVRGRGRRLVRLAILAILVLAMFLPYPYETGGAFTIIPAERSAVHSEGDPGGRIVQVFVKEGDFVRAEQPLAQIDPRPYERNVVIIEAQLEANVQKLRLMRKDQALLIDPPDIEAIQALEAEIRRLQATLTDARRQLSLTTLRAPIDGRVTTPLFEQSAGKYVKQGDLVATVEQAQNVRVEIQVPEGDQPQVEIGAPVKVVAWAYPLETFRAIVREIAPVAVTPAGSTVTTRTVRVVAEIQNPDLRLKTQLTGYAKIKTESIPVWLVLSRLMIRWFAVQVWYWLP
jgi:RND family efflux transporter MFP subunit